MADRLVAVVRHREAVLGCGDGEPRLPSAAVSGADPEAVLEMLCSALELGGPRVERWAEVGASSVALVAVESRAVEAGDACPDPTWVEPSALPGGVGQAGWEAYRAVAPTVEAVAGDDERGSTAIANDALWTLRDAATEADRTGAGLDPVASVATGLVEARPAMAAPANRVHRAMAGAETPAAVERAATEGLVRAHEADAGAATAAAEAIAELGRAPRVLTLSRSGTVEAALLEARPTVEVLASRPGGEGLPFAEALAAAGLSVTTSPDAAVYDRFRSGEVDALLVGADAVTPDGGVVNKVGTRAAALAAERAGVPRFAVCASDKVWAAPADGAFDPPIEPAFDLTPPGLVTAVLTERGRLSPEEIATIAAEHRSWRRWGE